MIYLCLSYFRVSALQQYLISAAVTAYLTLFVYKSHLHLHQDLERIPTEHHARILADRRACLRHALHLDPVTPCPPDILKAVLQEICPKPEDATLEDLDACLRHMVPGTTAAPSPSSTFHSTSTSTSPPPDEFEPSCARFLATLDPEWVTQALTQSLTYCPLASATSSSSSFLATLLAGLEILPVVRGSAQRAAWTMVHTMLVEDATTPPQTTAMDEKWCKFYRSALSIPLEGWETGNDQVRTLGPHWDGEREDRTLYTWIGRPEHRHVLDLIVTVMVRYHGTLRAMPPWLVRVLGELGWRGSGLEVNTGDRAEMSRWTAHQANPTRLERKEVKDYGTHILACYAVGGSLPLDVIPWEACLPDPGTDQVAHPHLLLLGALKGDFAHISSTTASRLAIILINTLFHPNPALGASAAMTIARWVQHIRAMCASDNHSAVHRDSGTYILTLLDAWRLPLVQSIPRLTRLPPRALVGQGDSFRNITGACLAWLLSATAIAPETEPEAYPNPINFRQSPPFFAREDDLVTWLALTTMLTSVILLGTDDQRK